MSKHPSITKARTQSAKQSRKTISTARVTPSGRTAKRGSATGSAKVEGGDPTPAVRKSSKLAIMVARLRRKEGATLEQLMKATGWQAHSVRGAIAGAIKKRLRLRVTSLKTGDVRTYHLAA